MGNILNSYKNPNDIKKMTIEELNVLSGEIREFLIQNIAKTGGHLAPNLGVVELTIALHNVFDFTKDKIVFDVGHQSYVHKILTGRKDKFESLRQYKGLSGFPKTNESIYDHFNTGHASTSISAAVGMARARDIKKEKHSVIALLGDGALTGGMTYEAINDIGFRKTKMIIVLNDNEMSISRNVGSMSTMLSKLRADKHYENLKKNFHKGIEKVPLGKPVSKTVNWMRESVKAMFVEGMVFENMGLKYLGPVDGHNIKDISKILEKAKEFDGPVLVHVVTQKGRGYDYAVEKPDKFHGIAPFDLKNGEVGKKGGINYSKAFGDALINIAKEDEDIVAITAAMRDGTGLLQYSSLFPDRFFDVGIAEEHAVTLASGMAISKIKPFVAIYSTFLQRSLDQLIHDVCIQKLPVKFCLDRAGIVGDDGETHQGIFDISFLSMIPNMTIVAPKCIEEMEIILKFMKDFNYPIALRYPRGGDDPTLKLKALDKIVLGQWEEVKSGSKTAIIASGKMLQHALKAIESYENKDEVALINPVFIKPIDKAMLSGIKDKYSKIITIEDGIIHGGLGEAIENYLFENKYNGIFYKLGYNNTFIEQGNVNQLYEDNNLSSNHILELLKNN